MPYSWVPGTVFKGDADEVGAELERLTRTGGLTPEAVVVAAKPKRSVLHGLVFDGTTPEEALETYRLNRARQLLKALIVVHEGDTEVLDVRAFHRVVLVDGEREWVTADVAKADPLFDEQVKRRLLASMRGLKTQLDQWGVFGEVAQALEMALAA